MNTDFDTAVRKRPVNLTLNENLVSQAKLLNAKFGSIADEYSSL